VNWNKDKNWITGINVMYDTEGLGCYKPNSNFSFMAQGID
jgi:hypothetical protein